MADNIFPLKVATEFGVIVRKVDPDRVRDERQQVEYEFSNGRQFRRYYRDAAIYQPILLDDYGVPILDDNCRSIPTGPVYVGPSTTGDFNRADFNPADFYTGTAP